MSTAQTAAAKGKKQPQDRQSKRVTPKKGKAVTSAQAWKQKGTNSLERDLEVPSGNVARVRRTPMEALLAAGVIPNSLLSIVEEAMRTQSEPELSMEQLSTDQMEGVVQLVDAVTVACVVEPLVSPIPSQGQARDEDRLYVDEVAMDDKLFIFQFVVGGTADLERFRQEQVSALDALSPGEDVAGDAS